MTDPKSELRPGEDNEADPKPYLLFLCDFCVQGKGGICNHPGCALIRRTAPDIALDVGPAVPQIGPCVPVARLRELVEAFRETARKAKETNHVQRAAILHCVAHLSNLITEAEDQ